MCDSFNITPDIGNEVPKALQSSTTTFSSYDVASANTQTLEYKFNIINYTPVVFNSSYVVNIGQVPKNGVVMNATSFSTEIVGRVNDIPVNLNGVLSMGVVLARNANEGLNSPNSNTVIMSTNYPDLGKGIWSPSLPWYPITFFQPLDGTYLNLEFKVTGTTTIVLTSGEVIIRLLYNQANVNNSAEDGYPTGGISVGSLDKNTELPVPRPLPTSSVSDLNPITNLKVHYDLHFDNTNNGYNLEYKPVFTWDIPIENTAPDINMEWSLFKLSEDNTGWCQFHQLSQRPMTTCTPLGLQLNPFPWLYVNSNYKIHIDIIADNPEQKVNTSLTFGGNPYPTPPTNLHCDINCQGTITEWNGSSTDSQPIPTPGTKSLKHGPTFGARIFWNSQGVVFGLQARDGGGGGPGCVDKWNLVVYENNTIIATYNNPHQDVIAPQNFYILNSSEGPHGKDSTLFVIPEMTPNTTYILHCEPVPGSFTPTCNNPPKLIIPFKTGIPQTPYVMECDINCTGTPTQWNGTITSTVPINGNDLNNPNDVVCRIYWSHLGLKYKHCVTHWEIKVQDNNGASIATQTLNTPQIIWVTNDPVSTGTWIIPSLTPSASYYIVITPIRNGIPGCVNPPSTPPRPFKMGHAYTGNIEIDFVLTTGNLPQTYITTYGIPSWGKTNMVDTLSEIFYSSGKQLNIKNSITTEYNQHQSWSMVRNWSKSFFNSYVQFISENEEMTNAMILMGDWLPILPASGLPVQPSTLASVSGDKYGQVAGSGVMWSIHAANYSYCAPNGPVDFGLSYNSDNTQATPPSGIGKWWDDDSDMIGCPLILDFLIPLARQLKGRGPSGTNRIVEISVNGDVSKNGNDGAYGSLDCGNYTAQDQRLEPFIAPSVILECILNPKQQWIDDVSKVPAMWGPLNDNKTQTVQITMASMTAFNTLIAGPGKPGNPISQNNLGASGYGTTALVSNNPVPSYNSSTNIATFTVDIKMIIDNQGKRKDSGFTITSEDPSVAKARGDARVYFAIQSDITVPNPDTVGTLYPVVYTNPAIGIFLNNWVIQQSALGGSFPSTAAILNPANINIGGIIGQISGNNVESWEQLLGSVSLTIKLSAGVGVNNIKPLLISTNPPQYDTTNPSNPASTPNYKHRIYKVSPTWDPNKEPIPPPTSTTNIYNLRVGSIKEISGRALPTIYNYGTLQLSATPTATGGVINRALGNGIGNSTLGNGGWLPSDFDAKQGKAYYPSYWNVTPNSKYLPVQPDGVTQAPITEFSSAGKLTMGGGCCFIGDGRGAFSGRGSYFDAEAVTTSTTRPGFITLSGIGTGQKGTYFTYDQTTATPATAGRVGFPVDNLHQLYILIYRINQKILRYNYQHATSNGYSGPDPDLVVPLISHVHHDKESYQVNKEPTYPVCDSTTGEIQNSWLLLNNTVAEITSMSAQEYEVWKLSRRQTSVSYEKYLYNRYMPAEYLPDWRTAGIGTGGYYMPHNTGCFIPNTGDSSTDGFTQTNAELLWTTVNKPWNVNQQRNFGLEPLSTNTSASTNNSGIGNYSNDFKSKNNGDPTDGIQRYNMGWVNYAVTAFAFGIPPNQTVSLSCTSLTSAVSTGSWVYQIVSDASGKLAAPAIIGATSISVIIYQNGVKGNGFTPNFPVIVYEAGVPIPVDINTAEIPVHRFSSQGVNEAYQELYNIGEVKPPVNLVWFFDNRIIDPNTKEPIIPSPNVTTNSNNDLEPYSSGTITGVTSGGDPVTATIDSIYNQASVVLKINTISYPNMFGSNTAAVLSKAGQPDLHVSISGIYAPTKNGQFPPQFIEMHDYTTSNEYGTGVYQLPAPGSGNIIPNELGSACIPGGSAPTCPGPGKAVFCPVGSESTSVGPYYRLNAVTNTLIARIFDKYGSTGTWPFLGKNAVNLNGNSPALTDLWLRDPAITTGVIPLDGRGFHPNGTNKSTGIHDGTYAPLISPYVSQTGDINLISLYTGSQAGVNDVSALDGTKLITGSDAAFQTPQGPREAIALFANEYIGGSLTLNPTIRPGTTDSGWLPVTKGKPSEGTLGPSYLPGSVPSWVGSRAMEVKVYGDLVSNDMNRVWKTTDGTIVPLFSVKNWKTTIESNNTETKAIFADAGWSFAANNWGGEYNGLSALQAPFSSDISYDHMQNFLKSAASMMSGSQEIGKAKVGLYTIGFIPETWFKGNNL